MPEHEILRRRGAKGMSGRVLKLKSYLRKAEGGLIVHPRFKHLMRPRGGLRVSWEMFGEKEIVTRMNYKSKIK